MTIKVTIVTTVSNQQRVRIYLEVCNDRLLVGGPRGQALVSVEQVPRPLHLQLPEHGAAPIGGDHLSANHSSPEGVGDDQDHDEEAHKEDDEGGQDGSHVLNMAPSVYPPLTPGALVPTLQVMPMYQGSFTSSWAEPLLLPVLTDRT